METYMVDVWGVSPDPDTFQNIEAETEQEAEEKGRKLSNQIMITNVEAQEM